MASHTCGHGCAWIGRTPACVIGAGADGLDRQGRADPRAAKSLVEQSRIIYAFSAAYLAGRSRGLAPVSAARRATALVAAMLQERLR